MPSDDITIEPIPGLPERPPAGEEILWQGRPDALHLARQSLGLYWIAAYFALLALWRFLTVIDLVPMTNALAATIPFLLSGLIVCAIIYVVSLIQARATMYTITTSRVVMRIGAALTLTINIPFRELTGASLDLRRSGVGTIALEVQSQTRLGYMICWPHVRPWYMARPQPALRCIPDAPSVARILADAAETRMSTPQVALRAVAAE